MKKDIFLLSLSSVALIILAIPLLARAAFVPPLSFPGARLGMQEGLRGDLNQVSNESLAQKFVELLAKENFTGAVDNFDSTMKQVLPPEKLQEFWRSQIAQLGRFKRQIRVRSMKIQQYDVVFVTCAFEKADFDIKVVFNNSKQIAGLFFIPLPPSYARLDKFQEKVVKVGNSKSALPGTLTLPVNKNSFSAIVLIQGSGPQDRDESTGPNKPFRDLAWGLASRGIAVLRYDKRTYTYPAEFNNNTSTVQEETIDDALAAVSLLRHTRGVDTKKIFVLGHSLGGMLIPRIAKQDTNIAGLVVMAGSTRSLEDIILEQVSYLFSLNRTVSNSQKAELEELKRQIARVKNPNLSSAVPAADLPLGLPASYWLDLRGYNPPSAAKNLKQPMLILQGMRDYQVTIEDFQNWQKSLSFRQNVAFKTYPKLNHLFLEGVGKSTPAEYKTPSHVPEVVVDDIANWISKQ